MENQDAIKDIKRKLYNAEKSKRSYLKRKDEIARRRAIARLQKGSSIHSTTIKEDVMTDEDRSMIDRVESRKAEHIFVPDRSPQFIQHHMNKITIQSQGYYRLLPEDNDSISYTYTFENTHNKHFTLQDAFTKIDWMIDNGYLMKKKSDIQKQIAKRNYKSKLHTLTNIYGTKNLFDIYANPERFLNKMMTSHISLSSIKGYISLLITFYNNDESMKDIIHADQLIKFKTHLKSGIKFSKEEELQRLENEPYYKWDDFKKIVRLINNHPLKNTVHGLRDQVIINMYVKENVLRDNLGMIRIVNRNPKESTQTNFLNLITGYMKLNDFKTQNNFTDAVFHISADTLYIIRQYIYAMESILQKSVEYLVTKNDGTPYKNGKLSSYIVEMFERYTGAKNVSINCLRHSVATHHKESPTRIKEMISNRLQHSWKQHVLYERHSDHHLEFPILKNNTDYDKEDPFLNETVAVIHTNNQNNIVILFGKIIEHTGGKNYLIEFMNKRYKIKEYELPNDKVIIM